MVGLLLETKLHVPRRRGLLVERPELNERLRRGAEAELTLVSAPAGFGKTTLVTEWLAAAPVGSPSTAWLSLDQRDNDPVVFWTYVVAALKTAVGQETCARTASILQSPQPSIDAVLATLVNDLHALSDRVVLVLDDYHVIETSEVHEGMAFLVEHLPARVHLVIASRADPALPLGRLRARGALVEIRAADLRFTPEESGAYLNEVMGLGLGAGEIAALEGRTEGWIAALQLAALSMQGREDIPGFIAGFAGDDRYIVDYLVEEVLQRQDPDVRDFLLLTCLLDRLCGPLCDAVTGLDGGKAMLELLDRQNLFVVPLDDRRRWYRYHHLFADVLQAHLLDERPNSVPQLHRCASEWYERNGEREEAIRHALAAGDLERAAELMELAIPAMRRGRQDATLRAWLEALPDEVVRVRPVLGIGFVGALVGGGELDGVEGRLLDAERWLGTQEPADAAAGPVVVDQEGLRRLPGTIELYRAALAQVRGDAAAAVNHARRALDLSPQDDDLGRAGAMGFLGLAAWASGDLHAADLAYAECRSGLQRAGHLSDVVGSSIPLAEIRIAQGRLVEALRTYEQGLQVVAEAGGGAPRGTADLYVAMSELLLERNDLGAAKGLLAQSRELGQHNGLPQHRHRWPLAMAGVLQAEGDLDGALDRINEAERLYKGDVFPNVRPIPAVRARLLLAKGALSDAFGWVRNRGLSAEDDLSYLHEYEHITLARVLLASYVAEGAEPCLREAIGLLHRLLRSAQEGQRAGSVVEVLVLQALALSAQGDAAGALGRLGRALVLAEPEGYVRLFVDEGPAMTAVLKVAAKEGPARGYVGRLLAATGTPSGGGHSRQPLIEPLSERELDVLRLLATDLDGPDIARTLVVSLNTIRSHTKHIYAKLGVNSRREAVRRAGELDLLSYARNC